MSEEEKELSQREKRRQQYEAEKPKVSMSAHTKKNLIVWGSILLIGGAVVTGMVLTSQTDDGCPGHWHGAYTIFVDGERVTFTHPSFNDAQNGAAPGTHIHGDDGTYHFHPAINRCTGWDDAFDHLGVDIGSDEISLDTAVHGARGGDYPVGDGKDLRIFERPIGDEKQWNEVTNFGSFLGNQPENGDAVVVIYGQHTQGEIDAMLEAAAGLEGGTYDPRRAG